MVSTRATPVSDFGALGARWRDLEQRAAGSFFQSWTWVGCLAGERFPDPVLVEATEDGRTVALGLFNRVRGRFGRSRLFLNESGSPALDCPYVEQNGMLTEAGREIELTEHCLGAVAGGHDLVLSGVDEAVLEAARRAAGGIVMRLRQEARFVDLASIRARGGDYLALRSANTRQQLRRSDRFYRHDRDGPIILERAGSPARGHAMLDAMTELHQATWQARGKPGSFSRPFFSRFHHALIEAGLSRGDVFMARVSCADTLIGYLYNFIWRGRMSAYQSGFAYSGVDNRARPGLTCHVAAIRWAMDHGLDIYDFLAGPDRYKRSLADRSQAQFWLEAGPIWSPRLVALRICQALGRVTQASADLTDQHRGKRTKYATY